MSAVHTELLIVGAGPYGLATAAYAGQRGIDYLAVGDPMGFWKRHMPKGMLLRSGVDWHLDAQGVYTFEAYLAARQMDPAAVLPISLERYLDYAAWFQSAAGVAVDPSLVTLLRSASDGYEAELADGRRVLAANVVVAIGIRHFGHVPSELAANLPAARYAHTCDLVDFAKLRGRRCLIVGGRQSAFEWAALIHEQGAAQVHLVYRHDTPRFEPSHWSWLDPLLDETARVPGWFRNLPAGERERIEQRFWVEGRLKLEPWLWPRLDRDGVTCWPRRRLASCRQSADGALVVALDDGSRLVVDDLILATGYCVDLRRLPFLAAGGLIGRLQLVEGSPALDEHFQANLPGLFFPGLAAARDFGPFFGFVRGCPVAARLIVARVAARQQEPAAAGD